MRKLIKTIVDNCNNYIELLWGAGGMYDSLAGEEIDDTNLDEINKCRNTLISIYCNPNITIPRLKTLLNHGLNKNFGEKTLDEFIEIGDKRIFQKKYNKPIVKIEPYEAILF